MFVILYPRVLVVTLPFARNITLEREQKVRHIKLLENESKYTVYRSILTEIHKMNYRSIK